MMGVIAAEARPGRIKLRGRPRLAAQTAGKWWSIAYIPVWIPPDVRVEFFGARIPAFGICSVNIVELENGRMAVGKISVPKN